MTAELTPTRARHHATTCCVPGCDQPRHPITPRNKSRFCAGHYRTHDQRLRSCNQPKAVTTDAALETLHQIRPPKPVRSYPATSLKWGTDATNWADYTLKCAFWRKRVDVWLLLNGHYRPPRVLNDVTRARAMQRLDELLAAQMERAS